MLKISKEVNLEELENFGFEYIGGMLLQRYVYRNSDRKLICTIYTGLNPNYPSTLEKMNELRRKQKLEEFIPLKLICELEDTEEYEDLLFTLINACLIEKE